jgi:hypothetical protein
MLIRRQFAIEAVAQGIFSHMETDSLSDTEGSSQGVFFTLELHFVRKTY